MQYVILFEEKFAAFFRLRLCVKYIKKNGTRIGSDVADYCMPFLFTQYVKLFEENFASFFPMRFCVKNKKKERGQVRMLRIWMCHFCLNSM